MNIPPDNKANMYRIAQCEANAGTEPLAVAVAMVSHRFMLPSLDRNRIIERGPIGQSREKRNGKRKEA